MMKRPAMSRFILILLVGLFFSNAYPRPVEFTFHTFHAEMHDGSASWMRSANSLTPQPAEESCRTNPESCPHIASWYQDRDNSMSPVSTEEGVGAAMATFWAHLGSFSQGIQVCPGVYLATAHGVLDDPVKARMQGRDLRDPVGNGESLLVGIIIRGYNRSYEKFSAVAPNVFIPSSQFCSDYESVCGQRCVELHEVLP